MSAFEALLGLLMFAGLVGVVVPALPGLLLIAGAGLAWALADPHPARWIVALVLVVLAVGATVAATILPARRASAAGAPRSALVAGVAGMIAGFFVIPVVGALVGFPAGIFVAERVRLRDGAAARATTIATLKGAALGIGIQLVAGVAMIAIWAAAVLLD
ncbi:MAG: DUF456 domain-containing protein [Actinomycetota bacterium]|jgi:uncharacterized protein|nr:DUF456 domain-containing protein [Actinomycetota bacterium]